MAQVYTLNFGVAGVAGQQITTPRQVLPWSTCSHVALGGHSSPPICPTGEVGESNCVFSAILPGPKNEFRYDMIRLANVCKNMQRYAWFAGIWRNIHGIYTSFVFLAFDPINMWWPRWSWHSCQIVTMRSDGDWMRHHFIGFRYRKTFPLRVSLPCGFHQGDWSSAAMHTERHTGRGCRTCILVEYTECQLILFVHVSFL